MAREAKGSFEVRRLADGTRAFHLRFQVGRRREPLVLHERPNCTCGCGGGWDESAARNELGNILARVRAGVWQRPEPAPTFAQFAEGKEDVPLFADYARWWLDSKISGVLGDRPIAKNTISDYRGRVRHLNAFFGPYPLDQIDGEACLAFKAHLLAEARELREALDSGAEIRDRNGRLARPLGSSMIRKIIDALAAILEEAVEDDHIGHNPARGRRMRVRVPKPKRTFLEMDELASLLDAAAEQDAPMLTSPAPESAGQTATRVAELASKGLRPKQIAEQLVARSRPSHTTCGGSGQVRERATSAAESSARCWPCGVRASELCDMKIGQVRLHDRDGARFRHPGRKDRKRGPRGSDESRSGRGGDRAHRPAARDGRADRPRGLPRPERPAAVRLSRQRVGEIVAEAAKLASKKLVAKGHRPLPNTTPHSLRRTYISIALLGNEFNVKWVMGQVGHADSKMTMDVYAQLEQRMDRNHGDELRPPRS